MGTTGLDPYRPDRTRSCPRTPRGDPAVLERLASACFRHRWRVVALWSVALVAVFAEQLARRSVL